MACLASVSGQTLEKCAREIGFAGKDQPARLNRLTLSRPGKHFDLQNSAGCRGIVRPRARLPLVTLAPRLLSVRRGE